MSIYSLGGGLPQGWLSTGVKFGVIGDITGTYILPDSMSKGSNLLSMWYWTHGNVSATDFVKDAKLPKNVAFLYSTAGPSPVGSKVVARVGITCSGEIQDSLFKNYGFEKGGTAWSPWYWSHPILCITTADEVPMDGKMVFLASNNFGDSDFTTIGSTRIILNTANGSADPYTSGWYWHSLQLIAPPKDSAMIIKECKANITNAKTAGCTPIMKKYCTAADIKSSGDPICNSWCSSNPQECDSIKLGFCAETAHAGDAFCDCINSSTRKAYLDDVADLKTEFKSLPKVCNAKICNTRTDLSDIFHTSSYLTEKKTFTCPSIEYTTQSVTVEGDGNTVQTDQHINKGAGTGGAGAGTGSAKPPPTNNTPPPAVDPPLLDDNSILVKYWWLLLLLFVVIVFILNSDDEKKSHHHHNDNRESIQT
jgi:hypothetical protein